MSENIEIEGLEYKKIDPSLKKIRRIITSCVFLAIFLIITVVSIAYYVNNSDNKTTIIFMIIFYLILFTTYFWAWWLVGKQIDNYRYAQAEKDLVISKGVIFREIRVIPYGRMQFVDVHQGPLLRIYKLASVSLHTASSKSLVPIPGIKEDEAKALRQELLYLGEANLAGL